MAYLETLHQVLRSLEPPLAAAFIAALVAILSLLVNSGLQVWKARIDRQIAREKATADRELAQHKFEFDMQLAERKMLLDARLVDRKRRAELANTVLADIYRARDAIAWARHPLVREGEGSTRLRSEQETEEDARQLDFHFVAIERLRNEGELFARLQAYKPRFQANFGQEAGHPFDEFGRVHTKIVLASHALMRMHRQGRGTQSAVERREVIVTSGIDEHDPVAARIDAAVAAMEALCRPILGQEVPEL